MKRAVNLLRPAQIGWGLVEVPEHLFNRRWFMNPGAIPPNPFGGKDLFRQPHPLPHMARPQLAAAVRALQPEEGGPVRVVPVLGGLHHAYLRAA